MDRWSIYVDVEGFSVIYERDQYLALSALSELMGALYRIGTTAFSSSPDRLFIHQFGDGFVIVSDFPETTAEKPLAISIAVMRHMLSKGFAVKAAISSGDFADVFSCYPSDVREAAKDGRHLSLGDGLMTIIPVMGMALISPYKLGAARSGALLLLDLAQFCALPYGVTLTGSAPTTVDWIHADMPMASELSVRANLSNLNGSSGEQALRDYIDQMSGLPMNWISSTLLGVGIES